MCVSLKFVHSNLGGMNEGKTKYTTKILPNNEIFL
jgi:hypothetical protein